MTPRRLARALRFKRDHYPISDTFETAYLPGEHWWGSQKEHVINWLKEMDGLGAYGRKQTDLDARHFWNHFQCAPGLLWVAEAVGVDEGLVALAAEKAALCRRGGPQCVAIRKVIPWEAVETRID